MAVEAIQGGPRQTAMQTTMTGDTPTLKELLNTSSALGPEYHNRLLKFTSVLAAALETAHITIRIHTQLDQDCDQDLISLSVLKNALLLIHSQ